MRIYIYIYVICERKSVIYADNEIHMFTQVKENYFYFSVCLYIIQKQDTNCCSDTGIH